MNRENAWTTYEEADIKALEGLCKEYKDFLSNGKTERECVAQSIELAKKAGYQDLEELIKNQTPLKAGNKVYRTWMEKTIALFQIGEDAIEDGLNILGAHIDSPRLDLKQNPLYEDTEMALLDTHYYGGVKKYQWVTLPMALHGVVVKKDGTKVNICIGEDDRVCAYTSLAAMLNVEAPKRTSCCILVDKEEIGSVGATGMHSRFFENTVAEILALTGDYNDLRLRRTLQNSYMLSSDVSAAFDPNYPSVMEKKNCAYFGKGLVLNKYTGARGKSGSNDANPEYIAQLRKIFDEAKVAFQTAELGKVDEGGGGTIAYIPAAYSMNVIDCGVAVLSMHAPWEITSKSDIYEVEKGYEAFLKNCR